MFPHVDGVGAGVDPDPPRELLTGDGRETEPVPLQVGKARLLLGNSDQVAGAVPGPRVVGAAEALAAAGLLADQLCAAVAADVVERPRHAVLPPNEKHRFAGALQSQERPGLGEGAAVRGDLGQAVKDVLALQGEGRLVVVAGHVDPLPAGVEVGGARTVKLDEFAQ